LRSRIRYLKNLNTRSMLTTTFLGAFIKSKEGGILNQNENRALVKQLSSAIKYLHQNSIAHRDLKMENILVKTEVDSFKSKITDFGLAEKQSVGTLSGKREFLEQFCGTPVYMAPEILQKHSYSVKCDIWRLVCFTRSSSCEF